MHEHEPQLLLTPGPLSTTLTVRQAMLVDHCTWDKEYNAIVNSLRAALVELVEGDADVSCVLMQGSGTFAVEATLGSAVPESGRLLVLSNGAYGERIAQIAERLRIPHTTAQTSERLPIDPQAVEQVVERDGGFTHLAMVHCETTTGLLNPAAEVGAVCRRCGVSFILDAMSSLGGIPLTLRQVHADFLISSANKCIQGVPGFAFVIGTRAALQRCRGQARSLSLDLYDQWVEMEEKGGKWRYTSPTHVVLAFAQALRELHAEGGVAERARRYAANHATLVRGMEQLGFEPLVAPPHRAPIITTFLCPDDERFTFQAFYDGLKLRGFTIYPGKVTDADTFRIGTIGNVNPGDIQRLIGAVRGVLDELGISPNDRFPSAGQGS